MKRKIKNWLPRDEFLAQLNARRQAQEVDNRTPAEKDEESYRYWNTECVMCGKGGAMERKDGRCYCGHCWTVWNS